MKKFLLILSLVLTGVMNAVAQEATVKSFEAAPMDLSAKKYSRLDLHGAKCALLKVRVVAPGVTFSGNVMGDVVKRSSEYWVYLPKGTKMLQIAAESFLPFLYNFPDPLQGGVTYVLTLATPQSDTKSNKGNASNVPVPGEPKTPYNTFGTGLIFDPAGCPYFEVKGKNHTQMRKGKTFDAKIYGKTYTFVMGDDHPNSTKALAIFDGHGQSLFIPRITGAGVETEETEDYYFDEAGFLKEDGRMQITLMDVDNDNICEVLFSIASSNMGMMETYVFRLLEHPYKDNIVKYVGCAEGQGNMFVYDGHIIAPFGSQGLANEYILTKDDRVVDISGF